MDPHFFTYSHVAFAQKKGKKKKQKGKGLVYQTGVTEMTFSPHDSSNQLHAFPLLLMQ